jgi:hypothetical protein
MTLALALKAVLASIWFTASSARSTLEPPKPGHARWKLVIAYLGKNTVKLFTCIGHGMPCPYQRLTSFTAKPLHKGGAWSLPQKQTSIVTIFSLIEY